MGEWQYSSKPCGDAGDRYDGMSSLRKDGKPRKRNQYPAPCWKCGRQLAPGEGCIELSNGQWIAMCVTR